MTIADRGWLSWPSQRPWSEISTGVNNLVSAAAARGLVCGRAPTRCCGGESRGATVAFVVGAVLVLDGEWSLARLDMEGTVVVVAGDAESMA